MIDSKAVDKAMYPAKILYKDYFTIKKIRSKHCLYLLSGRLIIRRVLDIVFDICHVGEY